MRAADIPESFPALTTDSDALEAIRMLAQQRLPEHLANVPPADFDDTLIEVAAVMARPLIPVTKDGKLQGVITASRPLAAVLKS